MRILERCPILVLLVTLTCCAACSDPAEQRDGASASPTEEIQFETVSVHRTAGRCRSNGNHCAEVTLIFPLAAGGRDTVRSRINRVILESLLKAFPAGETTDLTDWSVPRLETAAETFVRQWSDAFEADANGIGNRQLLVTGESAGCRHDVASVSLGVYVLHEDDHPVSYTIIHNFDLRNGALIGWPDLVDSLPSFRDFVSRQLLQSLEGTDLLPRNSPGHLPEKPDLPQHFELTEDGLYLWYNPFELGMFSSGPTDLLIPYDSLQGFLRTDRIGCLRFQAATIRPGVQ
ncbi:MAG: hypothetical protein RLY31_3130 [Bacteroidota bacterium]|jgi:hypothetical protein